MKKFFGYALAASTATGLAVCLHNNQAFSNWTDSVEAGEAGTAVLFAILAIREAIKDEICNRVPRGWNENSNHLRRDSSSVYLSSLKN
jgi:hypothetical protein